MNSRISFFLGANSKEKFVTYYTPFFGATSNKERALALVKSSPSVKDLSEETTYFKSIFQEIISKKIKMDKLLKYINQYCEEAQIK